MKFCFLLCLVTSHTHVMDSHMKTLIFLILIHVYTCFFTGVIVSFLSWGFFLPLARITYMAYLIHYDILMVFYYSMDYAIEMSNLLLVSLFLHVPQEAQRTFAHTFACMLDSISFFWEAGTI